MKNSEEMNRAVEMYADMVRRICLVHLKNKHDMEDVFQNVFLKYMLYKGSFENEEHEKAWLVRVTVNACGDWLRSLSRRRWIPLESLLEEGDAPDDASREVMEAVLQLPEKYRRVIYSIMKGIPPWRSPGSWVKRRIRSTPGFPEPGQCCGRSWEVSGHEQDS